MTSFALFLGACLNGPKTTSDPPYCPQWNSDEWFSYFSAIELALMIEEYKEYSFEASELPDIMPAMLATGALLKHCFPDEFEDTGRLLEEYREKTRGVGGEYMYHYSPDGMLDSATL